MKLSSLMLYLESLAPLSFQEDYDNGGLLIGNSEWSVTKTLLCLDVTMEVMREALERQCNLVIAHHPFIFKGLKKLTNKQPETEIIAQAIKNDIAIYTIHTNLDNTLNGLNAHVLSKLGVGRFKLLSPKRKTLLKLVTFCPTAYADQVRNSLFEAGAGQIGNYSSCSYNMQGEGTFMASGSSNPFVGEINKLHFEPEVRIEVILHDYLQERVIQNLITSHPYEEVAYDLYPLQNASPLYGSGLIGTAEVPFDESFFLENLKTKLNLPLIRHSPYRNLPVTTVAICTGSGGFLIPNAIRSGADIFLTADLKYHDFFHENRILMVADIGHYESEHFVKEWLHAVLIEKFPNFAFLISEVNTNPIHYL